MAKSDQPARDDSDWRLLAASAAGDGDAFAALVERHQSRLLALCERVLGDREEARDAAQEVFLKAYRHAGDAEPRGELSTWLYRIALNHCFNRLREAGRSLVVSSAVPLASIAFAMPDLHSLLSWGLRLRLEPLDDAAKGEVPDRRARALGIELPDDVRRFLLIRTSRNLGRLVDSLEALRVAALAGKRRLTLPLAREVLRAD